MRAHTHQKMIFDYQFLHFALGVLRFFFSFHFVQTQKDTLYHNLSEWVVLVCLITWAAFHPVSAQQKSSDTFSSSSGFYSLIYVLSYSSGGRFGAAAISCPDWEFGNDCTSLPLLPLLSYCSISIPLHNIPVVPNVQLCTKFAIDTSWKSCCVYSDIIICSNV